MFYLPDLEIHKNSAHVYKGDQTIGFYKMPALIHVARYIFTYEV